MGVREERAERPTPSTTVLVGVVIQLIMEAIAVLMRHCRTGVMLFPYRELVLLPV